MGHGGAVLEGRAGHVMCTLGHGVRVAGLLVAEVTAGHNTRVVEPGPWGADLSSVASL